jgi:hypothetical protein
VESNLWGDIILKTLAAVLLLSAAAFACAPDPCALGQVCSSTSYTPAWGSKPYPTALTIAESVDNFWMTYTLGDPGFCYYFHAAGGKVPYRWSLGKDSSFSSVWIAQDGSIHGLPGALGNYDLVVIVKDAAGAIVKTKFHVQVCAPGALCSGFGDTWLLP